MAPAPAPVSLMNILLRVIRVVSAFVLPALIVWSYEPSSNFTSLNRVFSAILSISARSALISNWALSRSVPVYTPLSIWIASSRILRTMLVISVIALSAVWTRDTPSLEFRMAIFMPRCWLSILLATAKPAASSAALLMRCPDDRRSIDRDIFSFALVA